MQRIKPSTMNDPSPDTVVCRIGDFLLISCAYIVFILYLSYATPLSPAMHTQFWNKIDTTQAHDNFTFVYDKSACLQPHLPQLYKSITAHISCVCHIPYLCLSRVTLLIAKHTVRCHYTSRHPIPHSPPTTPLPASQIFPRIPQITLAASHDRTAQQTAAAQTRTTLPLPHLYCAYNVFFLCLSCATAYSFIYCN